MPFEYIQNLENVIDIADEDHITTKCEATNIVSELRPQATHVAG